MPLPEFKFASQTRLLQSTQCKKTKMFSKWKYIKRSNIVMHTSIKQSAHRFQTLTALYRSAPPLKLNHNSLFVAANLDTTKSERPHYRIRTPAHAYDGKFLVFGTGNIIVAGTKSHAAAALGSIRMIKMLAAHSSPKLKNIWPSSMSVPNAVITGRLKNPVNASIKTSEFTNYSSKFPGIALRVRENRVTPELYLRRNMIIIPGITSSQSLNNVINNIEEIVEKHTIAVKNSNSQSNKDEQKN